MTRLSIDEFCTRLVTAIERNPNGKNAGHFAKIVGDLLSSRDRSESHGGIAITVSQTVEQILKFPQQPPQPQRAQEGAGKAQKDAGKPPASHAATASPVTTRPTDSRAPQEAGKPPASSPAGPQPSTNQPPSFHELTTALVALQEIQLNLNNRMMETVEELARARKAAGLG
jgi:hypothetical protein